MWQSGRYRARIDDDALVFERADPSRRSLLALALTAIAVCAVGNAVLLPLTWRPGATPIERASIGAVALAIAAVAAFAGWLASRGAQPGSLRELARLDAARGAATFRDGRDVPLASLRAVSTTVWHDDALRQLVLWHGLRGQSVFRGPPDTVESLRHEVDARWPD